ncbi:RAB6-interacting golgin [Drosophila grimshawi]|uniref:RAB6-interacting golgin n=1 Tax=Drosophila grimshawi TaxID=7222 RepID=B4J251_DROGR|nr:RAB6-interacting golgin [Drosophila grimshawi]EDV97002.1 GH14908 [Drosophila grimshawi]
MAEKFNGFSHDEILKITGTGTKQVTARSNIEAAKQALKNQPGIRRMPDKIYRQADQLRKQQQQQQQVVKAKSNAATPTVATPTPTPTPCEDDKRAEEEESLNLERGLTDSLVEALYCGTAIKSTTTTAMGINGKSVVSDAGIAGDSETPTDDSSILKLSTTDNDASILPSTRDSNGDRLNTESPFKGVSLKDFEQHRKMIEEQNKQKKQMLYKAIEQHTQKTAAESRKIEEIRHELSKLESDLAVDVALLRKQIDNACIHFANVEKQYVKIEAQFLRAKIELHNASEKKELLTEHLCTVIAHNEDRKAQKLTELMQKVGLAPTDEEPTASPTPEL